MAKKKIGEIYNKPIVIGDKNLVEDYEIHIDDLGVNSDESDEIVSSDFFYFFTGTYENENSCILIDFDKQKFYYGGEDSNYSEISEIEFISSDTISFKIGDGEDGYGSYASLHSPYPEKFKLEIVECYDSYLPSPVTGEVYVSSIDHNKHIAYATSSSNTKLFLTRCKLKITTAKGKVWYIVSKQR